MTFPSVWVAPGNRVVVAYGSGDVTGKLQFMAINAFPLAKLDDENIYWHWHTELTLPDDESVLKLFEIQDSTLALRDEVKYGITYGRDASNVSTDSLLRVLQRDAYEVYRAHFDLPEFSVGLRGASWEEWEDVPYIEGGNVWREVDLKRYELKDHLGNVRVIVSDSRRAKLVSGVPTDFTALIKHYSNYYPFGMEKPAMVWDKGSYRYGYQGQEVDNEMLGTSNAISYKYRVEDARLGRFFSIDPLSAKYPWNSPYAFSENRVIDGVELEGLEVLLRINVTPRVTPLINVYRGSRSGGIVSDIRPGPNFYLSGHDLMWHEKLPLKDPLPGRPGNYNQETFVNLQEKLNEKPGLSAQFQANLVKKQIDSAAKKKREDETEYVYRSMRAEVVGPMLVPKIGEGDDKKHLAAHVLPNPNNPNGGLDITPINGMVDTGQGGMSVSPSVETVPKHLLPTGFQSGTGKNLVLFRMKVNNLPAELKFDSDSPSHGTIQPSYKMTTGEYQKAIQSTQGSWERVMPPSVNQ